MHPFVLTLIYSRLTEKTVDYLHYLSSIVYDLSISIEILRELSLSAFNAKKSGIISRILIFLLFMAFRVNDGNRFRILELTSVTINSGLSTMSPASLSHGYLLSDAYISTFSLNMFLIGLINIVNGKR